MISEYSVCSQGMIYGQCEGLKFRETELVSRAQSRNQLESVNTRIASSARCGFDGDGIRGPGTN